MDLQELTKKCQSFMLKHPHPENDSLSTFQKIYPQFVECLTEHNHLYYVQSTSLIGDYQYDQLFDYLRRIEEYHPSLISHDSPTQQIINQLDISDAFTKSDHQVRMLSLQNSYNATDLNDLDAFIHRQLTNVGKGIDENHHQTSTLSYIIEPKFDGISVEVIYKDGIFTQAITRGDGYTGEDITTNVQQIHNIPHKLKQKVPGILSLRGEIMLPKSQLTKINIQREKEGLKPFANTRNASSGTIKLLDPNIVKKRGLVCYIYDVLYRNSHENDKSTYGTLHNQIELYNFLKKGGLPIFDRYQEAHSIDEVIEVCLDSSTFTYFQQQNVDFDGLVIKVNDFSLRHILGTTDHHPRRAMAYKFPAQQAQTQIKHIERQVGRTGILTPVAHLNPVQLSGVTISKASLHNVDFITTKDIRPHDQVYIQRSGEVIPYVVSVVPEKRQPGEKINIIPTQCPSCKTPVVINTDNDSTQIMCPNIHQCKAQIIESIIHFTSKQCMNIDGLGDKYVAILVEQSIIHDIADIYNIPQYRRTLLSRPGFSHKRVEELIENIEKSKSNDLRRFINGLGLPGIGKKLAKELAQHIQQNLSSSSSILHTTTFLSYLNDRNFLSSIYGIGETIITDLHIRSHDEYNRNIIKKLTEHNLFQSTSQYKNKTLSTLGQNIHFSITGSFSLPRPEIIEILESHGAILDTVPKKSTNFILVGQKPGSKATKAEKLGITTYHQLSDLLQDYPYIDFPNTTNKEVKDKPRMQSLFSKDM